MYPSGPHWQHQSKPRINNKMLCVMWEYKAVNTAAIIEVRRVRVKKC